MTERLSERVMWWTVFAAGGLGLLIFAALFTVAVWGIFAGAPSPGGR